MTKSMKRIHKVTIKRIITDHNTHYPVAWDTFGIRAEAEVSFPLSEMHTAKCIEINDKRAQYDCECEPTDSLIQHITSGGLWEIEDDGASPEYLAEIESEQLDQLHTVLHQIGFSNRAISAAMRDLRREEK